MFKNGKLYYDDKEGKEVAIGQSIYLSSRGRVDYFKNVKKIVFDTDTTNNIESVTITSESGKIFEASEKSKSIDGRQMVFCGTGSTILFNMQGVRIFYKVWSNKDNALSNAGLI